MTTFRCNRATKSPSLPEIFFMNESMPLQQIDRTYVRFKNRKLSYFSGCDYFRLASHPKVLKAVESGLKQFGLNVAASRLTTGNHKIYGELESALAKFFGTQDALLVSTGYVTNSTVAQALAGEFSHVLLDEKAHPALADAAQFFQAPIMKFKTRDVEDLSRAVKRCGHGCKIILLTDGMFSNNGSVAPLKTYLKILPRDAWLLVDDAHGGGTIGKNGRGAIEVAGVSRARAIQTVTLSKAFGVYGGAILCTREMRKQILARSKMFMGSTPLPPVLAAGAIEAIKILSSDKTVRVRLENNFGYLRKLLSAAGFDLPARPSPILPVIPKNKREADVLSKRLLAAGIFPPFVRYANGPATGYFRFVISSEHTRAQLDALISVLLAR